MQIDNQIASHRWRLRRANSYHIPDGTLKSDTLVMYSVDRDRELLAALVALVEALLRLQV